MAKTLESFRSSKTYNPKTFLAYFATLFGLVLVGATTLCGVLAWTGTAVWLIPFVFGFVGLVTLFVLVGIFVVMLVDPSKVMLTQVSGTEYVEIQRATLGDSSSGTRLEVVDAEHLTVVLEPEEVDSIPRSHREPELVSEDEIV
jgi:hypothetical protein